MQVLLVVVGLWAFPSMWLGWLYGHNWNREPAAYSPNPPVVGTNVHVRSVVAHWSDPTLGCVQVDDLSSGNMPKAPRDPTASCAHTPELFYLGTDRDDYVLFMPHVPNVAGNGCRGTTEEDTTGCLVKISRSLVYLAA